MTQKEEVFNKLEIIKEEYGIEAIREYMRDYNGKARKKKPRVNKRNETAADVYLTMFGVKGLIGFIDSSLKMSVTRSLACIANERDILETTVREHKRKFDAFANELNYKNFSCQFDNFYEKARNDYAVPVHMFKDFVENHFQDSKSIAYLNLDEKILIAFYLKHKYDKINN